MAKLFSPYAFLVVLRLFFVLFGFGYIHPDAFFQSSEVVAADVFGFETVRTWEFDPSHPCRTIFTPAIISGLPFLALKGLSYVLPNIVNPFTLLYFPRLFLFFASFIIDFTVWELSGHDADALLTLGSSWPLFMMINNSFSNTTETLLLAYTLLLVFRKGKSWSDFAFFGVLFAVGVFNRFTFGFFALPLVLYMLYEELKKDKGDWQSLVTGTLAGFAFMSLVIVIIDSVYFGSISISVGNKPFRWLDLLCPSFWASLLPNLGNVSIGSFSWTVTPVNSITYNTKSDNLAAHGTHLRITHLFWNMPLLFGPLAFVGLAPYYIWLDDQLGALIGQGPLAKRKMQAGSKRKPPKTTPQAPTEKSKIRLQEGKFSTGKIALVGVILSSIIFLSLATHQEMRFLLPTLIPFVLIGYKGILGSESNVWFKSGWIAFNIIMLLIMGVFHQGGVVPSILKIASKPVEPDSTTHVVYFHTYMPPQHLFGIKSETGKPKYAVYDLKGTTVSDLRKTLLRITEGIYYSASDKIYLVSPGTVDLENLPVTIHRRQWLHLSLEDPPATFGDVSKLVLNVYEYTPTK